MQPDNSIHLSQWPNSQPNFAQTHLGYTICSSIMFITGGVLMTVGFIFGFVLGDPEQGHYTVALILIGMGIVVVLFASCICCGIRVERSEQRKMMMENSNMVQRQGGIERNLAHQSNPPLQASTPFENQVNLRLNIFMVIRDGLKK